MAASGGLAVVDFLSRTWSKDACARGFHIKTGIFDIPVGYRAAMRAYFAGRANRPNLLLTGSAALRDEAVVGVSEGHLSPLTHFRGHLVEVFVEAGA